MRIDGHGSTPTWRRACSASACVEVGMTDHAVLVRNSVTPDGPILSFTFQEWRAFTAGVVSGHFEPPDQ